MTSAALAVYLAARVAAQASPARCWCREQSATLVMGSGIDFEPRGSYTLRGVPGEWELLAVVY